MRMLRLALVAVLALALATSAARADSPVVVFAAASLKTALDETATAFHGAGGADAKISYGGSLALARQMEQGAPADIFISADEDSMDEAAKGKAIKPESRFDFLANTLVIVANKSSPLQTLPLTEADVSAALGSGKLATGEVSSVPVGKYAKEALTNLKLWDAVSPHLAMTDNVRAALAFVARDEAPLGIVYATDAAAEPAVKVVATFPDPSHKPIVYPAALSATSANPDAVKLLDFLRSPAAREIFARQGFKPPPEK
ncbi:MAG TPA: molybdate ABC transporter substrate-binding protein [Roseiarcus sp.]|nr:molybdate ABC transporter substrate-binding protein [Roseiarcus sp.]